ncbi:DNA starvation/stationary phase protection protein Dps [Chloroflexus sp.]|uniref:DNA starvation/stationary phase protection protein Dps n=1 Tax=Chloroflexus sp. TaxID=1904827 RepID=UPI00298ED8F5|nr:DNA starvation/stationary phase protection protein Dps [Chloroflexus sp.]MCS6889353.1 DNA starvation/stationary phase protection protein Dps [Chloroflexus sp.]MDW8402971.1 DNA starvation/stationary phase protection protein Dps [Chloroflexus sp.]
MTQTTEFATRIDLPLERRRSLVAMLNQQLADTFDLMSQAKQAHWNVKGPHFMELHELFDELAGHLNGFVDALAERVTALGGMAMGTARMAAAASRLPEYPADITDGMAHVAALADRFAAYGQTTRQAIDFAAELGDQATADLMTEIARAIDKDLWFLEAHLQG